MKNIIIFYQVINRELGSCKKLKELLELEYNIKVYIYSIDFEHDLAIKLSKKTKIDMIIMPWMYQDLNYVLMNPFIKRNPELKIINLHHEQIASEASINLMLPTGKHSTNCTIHFTWGDFFKDALISSGVNSSLVYVTGNIRTDMSLITKKDRQSFSKEFDLDPKKQWILFSENRGWVLTSSEKKEKHLCYLGYSEDDMNNRKKLELESLNISISEMNRLDDKFFNRFELIYRPHPGTIAPTNIKSNVKIIDKYPIYEWLNVIDINLVWSSTTIFESDLMGVPSFVYEPIPNHSRLKTFGLEKYQTIKSLTDINDDLIEQYKNKIEPQKIFEQYIGKVDGKSVERVKKTIIKILDKGISIYSAEQIKGKKLFLYRIILFQKITRAVVKTKLLNMIKFPKSAYELRKDIPYHMTKE